MASSKSDLGIIKAWEEVFRSIDFKELMVENAKRLFDGFETYDDYVKYGDLFERVEVIYTPYSHQLKQG